MKDCFRREIHLQKQRKSGKSGTKRRKYMYFGQMLFLISQTQDRATSSNYSLMSGSNGEEDTDERRRMNTVQVVVQPKLLRVERNGAKVTFRER